MWIYGNIKDERGLAEELDITAKIIEASENII